MDVEDAFKLYYRPLNLFALHYIHNVDACEDIVQQCFADMIERINDGNGIENMRKYLYSSVRNRCIDKCRRDEVTPLVHIDDDLSQKMDDDDELQKRSEIEAKLWSAIDSLPDKCREIFLMNKRDGMKYKEIAEKTGISVNTVENHVLKALRVLREKGRQIYYFIFG